MRDTQSPDGTRRAHTRDTYSKLEPRVVGRKCDNKPLDLWGRFSRRMRSLSSHSRWARFSRIWRTMDLTPSLSRSSVICRPTLFPDETLVRFGGVGEHTATVLDLEPGHPRLIVGKGKERLHSQRQDKGRQGCSNIDHCD